MTNSTNTNKSSAIGLVLTLIYPLGAFIYALRNIRSKSSFWIFFAFNLLYGLCFVANLESIDSFYYVEDFMRFSVDPSLNFHLVIKEFFSADSSVKDVFVYSLFYLTNILAGANYHVFFLLVSLIFSTFFLLSFRFITNDYCFKNKWPYLVLAFLFVFSNTIFNINGVRFWTAAWVAVYGTFQVLVNDNKKGLVWIIATPLIHGAFYVYILFAVVAFFVRYWYKFLPVLFVISFFVTDVALNFVPGISDYLPPFLQNMIWAYTESDYALSRMSGEDAIKEALYARILMALPRYVEFVLIFLLIKERKHFVDKNSMNMLGFLLALGSLINMSSMIPSMLRFWQLLIPFVIYLWVHNAPIMSKYFVFLKYVPLLYVYPVFRLVRMMIWTTDPLFFVSNSIHIVLHSLIV